MARNTTDRKTDLYSIIDAAMEEGIATTLRQRQILGPDGKTRVPEKKLTAFLTLGTRVPVWRKGAKVGDRLLRPAKQIPCMRGKDFMPRLNADGNRVFSGSFMKMESDTDTMIDALGRKRDEDKSIGVFVFQGWEPDASGSIHRALVRHTQHDDLPLGLPGSFAISASSEGFGSYDRGDEDETDEKKKEAIKKLIGPDNPLVGGSGTHFSLHALLQNDIIIGSTKSDVMWTATNVAGALVHVLGGEAEIYRPMYLDLTSDRKKQLQKQRKERAEKEAEERAAKATQVEEQADDETSGADVEQTGAVAEGLKEVVGEQA